MLSMFSALVLDAAKVKIDIEKKMNDSKYLFMLIKFISCNKNSVLSFTTCLQLRLPPSDHTIQQVQNDSRYRAWTFMQLVLVWWKLAVFSCREQKLKAHIHNVIIIKRCDRIIKILFRDESFGTQSQKCSVFIFISVSSSFFSLTI